MYNNKETLLNELNFKAVRSSGSGGQHVNKVSSKIELSFNLKDSLAFNEEQKQRLLLKLQQRLTKTKIPKSVIRKRLKNKRNLSEKKANRKKPNID